MKQERILIGNIPAMVWGEPSESVYIYVHGKFGSKYAAEDFAQIADERGHQTLSFDLPAHGERGNVCSMCLPEDCNVFTGMRDLESVIAYADEKWTRHSLFACSLGAYFALCTYSERSFERALFQSPIVDMIELTRTVGERYGITPEQLAEKKRIFTPIETLDWDYYSWIIAHPIEKWSTPTCILYAGRDDLQTRTAIDSFAAKFAASVTVAPTSLHPFMEPTDASIVESWLRETIHEF